MDLLRAATSSEVRGLQVGSLTGGKEHGVAVVGDGCIGLRGVADSHCVVVAVHVGGCASIVDNLEQLQTHKTSHVMPICCKTPHGGACRPQSSHKQIYRVGIRCRPRIGPDGGAHLLPSIEVARVGGVGRAGPVIAILGRRAKQGVVALHARETLTETP